ncbi:hypothetical protein HPC49_53140 [Pyxidicoccus fallax]|uniref:Uncharacterized protein n=2 Tax=Pyxidicoccus fallax TaxID=394095 RepID=A0A848LZP8_9BACT|nr:hypothetical protein [Pyxidicoccus fallax]NPC86917.1 hypothetical protein [Pyxidicoccus fallax]
MRLPLSLFSLSLCLGIAAPAAAEEATSAPEAQQATSAPEAQQAAAVPADADGPVGPMSAPAFTPPRPPDLRVYFQNMDFLRYNPIGIESQNRLIVQKRLSDSTSPLFADTFINGAAVLKLNPAGMKMGPAVEFQPLTILNLKATYEYCRYFGAFGFLQSYPGPLTDFSDDARSLTEDNAYSTGGHHYMVEPTLQAKVGSVVVRSKASIEYWNIDLRDGTQGAFYDALLDTLIPGKGWVFTNDSDVLMLYSPQIVFGARFSGVWPRYQGEGSAINGDNSHMRIGPMVSYAFNTRERSSFNRPTLFVNAAWYLKHPNRDGALPYLAAGFSFTSDLVSVD